MWLLTIQFPVIEAIVESRWALPYDRNTYYISDLGAVTCFTSGDGRAVCSPWHTLMNISFVLQGVLIIGGAVLLWRTCAGATARAGLGLLILSGIGVAVVGFYPEDTIGSVHYAGAAANFAGSNAGLVLLAAALVRRSGWRAVGIWIGVLGIIGLIALGLFVAEIYLGLGIGGIERVIAYTLPLALPVLAVRIRWSVRARPSL